MAQMVFRVIGIVIENNIRGEEMRRLNLRAIKGEAFTPEKNEAPAEGSASMLVTPAYIKAKKLQLGDEVTLDLQERVAE